MVRYNYVLLCVDAFVAAVRSASGSRTTSPAPSPARSRRRRSGGSGTRRRRAPTEVNVTINVTNSAYYFEQRGGRAPTRVLPASRMAFGDNPVNAAPTCLPGAASEVARLAFAPADPDGPRSIRWPGPDR